MERKLSTILASDVVGFSKMIPANEEHKKLDRDGKALEMPHRGIRVAGISIAEFADSQPFQDQTRNRKLQELLESVEPTQN